MASIVRDMNDAIVHRGPDDDGFFVDDGIALMTGKTAGDRHPDGKFATGTLNHLVEDKLAAFAQTRRNFGQSNRDNHST